MTRLALDAALAELGWTMSELCRRLGLHRNTPRRWKMDVPQYVAAYVGLALQGRRDRTAIAGILKTWI